MIRFVVRSLKYAAIPLVVLFAGGAAVFGPYRVQELCRYVKETAAENLDDMIPDEVELRHDMEKLREEYPARIAELKSMSDEIARQLAEVERDRSLCREVLTLCGEDLEELRPKLETPNQDVPAAVMKVEFRGAVFTRTEAAERSRKILDIKELYEARLAAANGSVDLLESERARLRAELVELQKEYDQFIAGYRGLERQIDLLRHNEKLIEIASRKERLGRLDSAGWVRSLDAVQRAIERRRTEQEERLRSLKVGNPAAEYEARARVRAL